MKIGLRYPVCAPYSVGQNNTPEYGEGFVLGAAVSITPATENSDAEFWADDELHDSDTGVSGGTISEEISHINPKHYALLLGHKYTAAVENTPAEVEISKEDQAIEVGHGYIVVTREKDETTGKPSVTYVAVWYSRVKFSEPNDTESKTKTKTTEFSSVSIEGRWDAACNGVYGKKAYCDTEDEAKAYLNALANIKPAAAAAN